MILMHFLFFNSTENSALWKCLQIFKKNGGGFRTLSFVWDKSENKIVVLMMKIMILIRWLPAIFRLWYIYECLLGSQYTSTDFTFDVFSLLIIMTQQKIVFSKSEMGALERVVGYIRRWWWRHPNDVNVVVLVSLWFALDMFHASVYCFSCWLWACKRLQGILCCKHLFLHFS